MNKTFKQCTTRLLTDGSVEVTTWGDTSGDVKIEQHFIYYNEEWNTEKE